MNMCDKRINYYKHYWDSMTAVSEQAKQGNIDVHLNNMEVN